MIDLSALNDQQKAAAEHNSGPCLVLATAGSGKTRVLTTRAARLISDMNVPAERILLATFTKKAAEEMKSRLCNLVGEERAAGVWIGTFHSHCLRILRISSYELGFEPFDVLPPGRCIRFARDILAEADSKHPYGMGWDTDPKGVLAKISRAKADLFGVDRAERYFREKTDIEENLGLFIEFWKRYELAKAEATPPLVDFDDFLLNTYQLLRENPIVLERWQNTFDYILEDEVQDTMIAQSEIVKLLAAKHRNYFAVGDIDQSIYGFRGSDPRTTTMSFRRTYPDGKIIQLPINYRSQQHIVDLGMTLIHHNEVPPEYRLSPMANRGAGKPVQLIAPGDEDAEADAIGLGIVNNLLDGHKYRDISVLYRTNAQSRALEDAMIIHDIPYVVHGSCGFYDRREVVDVLAYLQLAHYPKCERGDEALRRVINIATNWYFSRGERKFTHFLGAKFLNKLETIAHRNSCSFWEALNLGDWDGYQWDAIGDFSEFVAAVQAAGPAPRDMIAKAREAGYDEHLAREMGSTDEDEPDDNRFENLDELTFAAAKFDNSAAFLDFVTQQRSRAKSLGKDQDAVQLLTIHRSKGLEWPVVYLAGVSQGLLPHRKSLRWFDPETKRHIKPESLEEERRLCYVGITRAMDELMISAPVQYQQKPLSFSPFLKECGFEEPIEFAQATDAAVDPDADFVQSDLGLQ